MAISSTMFITTILKLIVLNDNGHKDGIFIIQLVWYSMREKHVRNHKFTTVVQMYFVLRLLCPRYLRLYQYLVYAWRILLSNTQGGFRNWIPLTMLSLFTLNSPPSPWFCKKASLKIHNVIHLCRFCLNQSSIASSKLLFLKISFKMDLDGALV